MIHFCPPALEKFSSLVLYKCAGIINQETLFLFWSRRSSRDKIIPQCQISRRAASAFSLSARLESIPPTDRCNNSTAGIYINSCGRRRSEILSVRCKHTHTQMHLSLPASLIPRDRFCVSPTAGCELTSGLLLPWELYIIQTCGCAPSANCGNRGSESFVKHQ